MKLIPFVIFIIIFNSISTKNLKPVDIFKGDNSRKNFNSKSKAKSINSIKNYHLNGPKYLRGKGLPRIYKKPLKCYTGIKGISCDKDLNLENERFFISCCVIGGLTNNKQILNAFNWAKKNNYLTNDKKSYKEFAKKISVQYKTHYHSDWKIKEPKKGLFLVENSKNAIFNSAGFGKKFNFNPNK